MGGFVLTGDDIDISYRTDDDTLTVSGDGLPLGDGPFTFTGAQIARSESADGRTMSVVLLDSTRDGSEIRLVVLHPDVTGSPADHDITGAAIIVRDGRNAVGGTPPVRQRYRVRALTGSTAGGAS